MRDTISELVNALQGKTVEVESVDTYGMNINFSKVRIEYDEAMNELSFVVGWYANQWGFGGISYRINDIVNAIRLEDDGSYTIEFNQYMADINIKESDN